MRLYLDSSALVKAFVEEEGRDKVIAVLSRADVAATSRLAYVECRAAFARALREGRLSEQDERSVTRALDQRWGQLAVLELDDSLMRDAAVLTRTFSLRAADAVHLASAVLLAGEEMSGTTFACWDTKLTEAAASAGLEVIGPE